MATETTKSIFWQGARDCAPFVLVIVPFSMLFGVVATEAGLRVLETLTFSVVVIAGAAQFTALELLGTDAPTLIVIVSSLTVNLRHAMYSAALTPHLGAAPLGKRALAAYLIVDQTYALSVIRYAENPHWSIGQRLGYFFGIAACLCPLWYGFTVVGALIGTAIPQQLPLDFAVPITFLALIGPMLRTRAHMVAALASVVAGLLFAGLPYSLGLLVAALAGMTAGAEAERRIVRAGGRI